MSVRTGATSMAERPHVLLAGLGIALVSLTSIVGSGFSVLSVPFALWSALPYGALWLVGRSVRNPWPILGAGTAALAAELGVRAGVFLWPRGSTAAIALVFSPAYIGAVVMPIGAALGWVLGTAWQWHIAGRALVTVTAPLMLGLLTLGLARPDLFPTTVARRRALIERVGPPRVVTGEEVFESRLVSEKAGWYQTANLDGEPGEEIAIVDHQGAELIDATTLAVKSRLDFRGEPGRLWGSFAALARLPGERLVIAHTGGGFSRTFLQDLNGVELWEFKPHPTLPPDALRPADLDDDLRVEFYGASAEFITRLDDTGKEVWRRPSSLAALIALLPPDGDTPAWVVGLEYGRKVRVWDASGQPVAERPSTADDSPLTAIDSFAGRSLVHGGRSARLYGVDGTLAHEMPLGDFTLSQALGARLLPGQPHSVVLVGSTDRDTRRYRLLVVNPDRQTVYDEILDRYPRVLVARRADGSHAILMGNETGLRVLRPR